jgi:hypothetical protein
LVRIDPQGVVVAVGSGKYIKRFAAIDGMKKSGVGDVDAAHIFGIGPDVSEVPGSLTEAVIVID